MSIVNEQPLTEKSRFEKFKEWIDDLLNSDEEGLTEKELDILNNLRQAETSVESVQRVKDLSIITEKSSTKLNIHHPSYFGFPFSESIYRDFRGNSSNVKATIISYEVPANKVALIRKLAIPYYANDFGSIKLEVMIDSKNIIGSAGVIEQYHWFENSDPAFSGSNIEITADEQASAQAFSCVISMLLVSESVWKLIAQTRIK